MISTRLNLSGWCRVSRAGRGALLSLCFVFFSLMTNKAVAVLAMPGETLIDPARQVNSTTPEQNYFEHIDPYSHELSLSFTDLVVPGNGGLDIVIQRVYNHTFVDPDAGVCE